MNRDIVERLRERLSDTDGTRVDAHEIEQLRRWKSEAQTVLIEWEYVWAAAGHPGARGSSKPRATLDWIARLL